MNGSFLNGVRLSVQKVVSERFLAQRNILVLYFTLRNHQHVNDSLKPNL